MYVHYNPADQPVNDILANTKLEKVQAAEVFSELVDLRDAEKDAKDREALFLFSIEEDSYLDFKKYDDAHPDGPAWILFDGKDDYKIRPELVLKIKSRLPLAPASKDRIELKLVFKDSAGGYASPDRLDNFNGIEDSNYGELNEEQYPGIRPKPLNVLFTPDRKDFVEHSKDELPRVLRFDHFAPDVYEIDPQNSATINGKRKPGGDSYWTVRFAKLKDAATRAANDKKWGLSVEFERRKSGAKSWGVTEENATKLWPLNIAPAGVEMGKPDLVLYQAHPGGALDDFVSGGQNAWVMEVRSFYDQTLGDSSFTPFAAWNRFIAAPHYNSLGMVKGSNPGSVVPHFIHSTVEYGEPTPDPAKRIKPVWVSDYDLLDRDPHADGSLQEAQFDFKLRGVTLGTKDPADTATKPVQLIVKVDATLENFLDHDGHPIRRRLKLTRLQEAKAAACRAAETPVAADEEETDKPLVQLRVDDVTIINQQLRQPSRIGALSLHFSLPDDTVEYTAPEGLTGAALVATLRGLGQLVFLRSSRPQTSLVEDLESEVLRNCRPEIDARLYLMLSGLSPGGQDPLPQELYDEDERLLDTIIIPSLSGSVGTTGYVPGPFVLVAKEKSHARDSQSLDLRLEKRGEFKPKNAPAEGAVRSDDIDFIIIDLNPFLLARVRRASLKLGGDKNNPEIGNWNDAESFWELADKGESFELILPPQAVGEELIKDYDLFKDDAGRTLYYKFSPPAILKLFRSSVRQNFTEPPWNVRRLLGYIKGKEEGVVVDTLEFELLFGLTTTVRADFLRLAELNSRLGFLPSALGEHPPFYIEGLVEKPPAKCDPFLNAYFDLRKEYGDRRKLLQRRLAHLFPWSVAQKGGTLTLDSGVSYSFRPTRQVVHPTVFDYNDPAKGFLPREEGGLRGGVDWGFESTNIHREVYGSKTSSSGKIVGPSFTALGGSGYQKAGFANDKSTIFSNAFLGRTFFYSLQRIGRVSVLWHTAKHVIIYQRSVADSDQFMEGHDELGNEEQGYGNPKWRGRPAIRKLEEYVEILQPERSYPEFGEAPKIRGFVLGGKFPPHTRIRVNSKWGRDIPGGWIVPLYNQAANPDIYPKPEVYLRIATSEESGKAQTWGRITNPEVLYFYTSTDRNTGVNTDEWPAVPDVDYPLESVPQPPAPDVPTHAGSSLDAKLPDPPPHEGGYEHFTYHLDTSGQTANLLQSRTAGAMEALIENVSMARRSLRELSYDAGSAARQKIAEVITRGSAVRDEIRQGINSLVNSAESLNTTELKNALAALNVSLAPKLQQLGGLYASLPLGQQAGEPRTIKILKLAQDKLQEQWESAWVETQRKALEEINKPTTLLKEAREALDNVKRQVEAAEPALGETIRSARRVSETVSDFLIDFNELLDVAGESIGAAIATAVELENPGDLKPHLPVAVAQLTLIHGRLQSLRNLVGSLSPDLWAGVEEVTSGLIELLLSPEYEDWTDAHWQEWVDEIRAAFYECGGFVETLVARIDAYIAALQSKYDDLVKLIDGAADQIEQLKAKALDDIRKELAGVLGDVETQVKNKFFAGAKAALDTLKDSIVSVEGDIDAVVAATTGELAAAVGMAQSVLTQLEKQPAAITSELREAVRDLTNAALANVTQVLSPFERQVRDEAKRIDLSRATEDAKQLGDKTLRLVRAYGLAPVAQSMNLNRDRLAYYFNEARDAVDFTPAAALVNRVGQEIDKLNLKTIGIRLPSRSLLERFVADNIPRFELRDILPNFAGLSLDKLFEGVKIPSYANDAVKVTHGISEQTRQAWVRCDVLMKMSRDVSLFSLGPVEVRLVNASFEAHSQMSISAQDPDRVERSVTASIRANWHLLILNQIVLTIEDSTLRYDNSGKLHFDMSPSSVKLPAAMQFLTDLIKTFRPGKSSGLSFELVFEGFFPVGARAVLSLPLPPVQTGAFAVSHLALNSRFEVAAPGGRFYVGAGLSLSSKERPFTLTILFLGGGGWVDTLAIYRPFEEGNKLSARLSIGLSAGADFTFDISVVSGTVYFLVSLYAEFTVGGGSNLRIALRLAIGGEVSVLGIVTVNIEEVLEASYESGGTLRCRGTLSLSIEICWCFTLEVHAEMEFTLAGSGSSSNSRSLAPEEEAAALADAAAFEPVPDAVDRYLDSFGD
jgi:hypothetical protein